MSRAKGSKYERELATTLQANDFSVVRAGSSGSATQADRPDLLAGKNQGEHHFAIELKYTKGTTAYADRDEVVALTRWANAFGALPVVVGRFRRDTTYYFVEPSDCRKTDSGNYGVPHADAAERAVFTVEV